MTSTQPNTASPAAGNFLRNLYFSRTVVQIVWAAVVIATAPASPAISVLLVVLYPLWDVICTVRDLRSNPQQTSRGLQIVNAVLGVAAAAGAGIFGNMQLRYAVAAFGVWALAAGLLQLGVGIARRKALKGQWAMMLSGAQSAAAGTAFLLGGLQGKVQVKDLGGYAVFGAVYFLVAGLLLHRKSLTEKEIAGAPGY
jgi:uncharacterized membrane protein HdeD (DUF308 family)